MSTAISDATDTSRTGRPAARCGARCHHRFATAAGAVGIACLVAFAGPLAGCGGSRQVYRSPILEREIELNRKAAAAFERGQHEQALAGYREALQLSRAIEHVDGIAANLLDLAATHRALGDAEQAAAAADEVLSAGVLAFTPAQRADAAYLRALLHADGQALPDASRLAAAARALCRESACGGEGRIVNLQASIALLAGDREAALAAALEALALNRKAKADRETANSLRIAADVRTAIGLLKQAEAGYQEALALDKRLGLAAKISLDLIRLGDVAAAQGRGGDARAYYRRALDVSRAAADERGADEAEARIRRLADSL